MRTVHVVVPAGIDDPARPSGGNHYDRRLCAGLIEQGWLVLEHRLPGSWPVPGPAAQRACGRALAGIPDRSLVLVDGLIASSLPAVLVPEAQRLELVVLVHLPLGAAQTGGEAWTAEWAVLNSAALVIATSRWTSRWLLAQYRLPPERVSVAEPGVDAAGLAAGTPGGGQLLCVGAVSMIKGHDVLMAALAGIADLAWRCDLVGALDTDPVLVARLRDRARAAGITPRVHFVGPLVGAALQAAYAAADVLVLASRTETYGMVVTEALAHGLPVIATGVGGVPETLGHHGQAERPGLLVPPADPPALGAALSAWLGDAGLRSRLRSAARERRRALPRWATTAALVSHALGAAAESERGARR